MPVSRTTSSGLQIVLLLAALLNLLFGGYGRLKTFRDAPTGDFLHGIGRLVRVMQLMRRYYVDSSKTRPADLFNAAIDGMFSSLDVWSHYMRPTDVDSWNEESVGEYGGIGIYYEIRDQRFTVTRVTPESPAAKAQLQAGDVIAAVDGTPVTESDLRSGVVRIRGKEGTTVRLNVQRGEESFDVTLTREIIRQPQVIGTTILGDGIGYFRLLQFSENGVPEFQKALDFFREKRVRGLILDLRDNPGGNVDVAAKICSMFLTPESTVVTMKGQDDHGVNAIKSTEGYLFPPSIPLILLVNGNSASAAELTAGCLKDHGRATLVGTKTFGKGVAQTLILLGDGTGVKLTTSRFYTPDPERPSIHGHGIEPDFPVPLSPEEDKTVRKVLGDEEAPNPEKDPQLRKAVEVLQAPESSAA